MTSCSYLKNKLKHLKLKYAKTSEKRYIRFLKTEGIAIGDNVHFYGHLKNASIDLTRPSLITIGDNVSFNDGIQIITHDFASWCFRYKYGEFINSSGSIRIGNNVGFGRNVVVLKGVTIGDNCFIGINSVVMSSIPPDSVAAGCPAKVICSIDEYYEKRKLLCVQEAFEYARSIQDRFHRRPTLEDFWEEFPLFVDGENIHLYPSFPYKRQLGNRLNDWIKNHKRRFDSFGDFLKSAGVE